MIRLLSTMLFALSLPASAEELPGDSVVSRKYVTSSAVPVSGASHGGHSIILDRISLASQTTADVFVRYGPFFNRSGALLTVALKHLPSQGHHDVVGLIDGAEVASDPSYISYQVPPQTQYGFVAKGAAMITVTADRRGLTSAEVGLPNSEDFSRPRGAFVKCVNYRDWNNAGGLKGSQTVFYYAEGSMTDKSHSLDSIRGRVGLTTGIKPPVVPECEAVDYFDPGS